MDSGKFIVSLDFELYWGVRDKLSLAEYGENVKGVHTAMPKILDLFNKYNIKGTFAVVGFLFCENKKDLLAHIPSLLPEYKDKNLSPYNGHIDSVGENVEQDPHHFAPELIQLLLQNPMHEIGTHTYSHYYCLEEGQTVETFRADIRMAKQVAAKYNLKFTSLVFPRNQMNEEYLHICEEEGIICYRGNETASFYQPRSGSHESSMHRAMRLADSYFNLSGHNSYSDKEMKSGFPYNIPASRFLRPYSPRLAPFNGLKLKRITSDMTYAARNAKTYHIWWHPHNFGINQEENIAFLEKILQHYEMLNKKYGFASCTMTELANHLRDERNG